MSTSGPFKTAEDRDLLLRYQAKGELDVLGELYNRYMSMVYGVCLKYLKDREESRDAVMQIFEKLVVTLREHEVTHFKSWLYATTRNHCLMQLRFRKGKNFEEISTFLMETNTDAHPEEEIDLETNLSKLEKCMNTLNVEQKSCVELFYMQQKCYKEIIQVTGYDDTKVKSYIQNGKRNLKLCMDRNE